MDLVFLGGSLPLVKDYKYLRILSISCDKRVSETDRSIGLVTTVLWALRKSVFVTRELSCTVGLVC